MVIKSIKQDIRLESDEDEYLNNLLDNNPDNNPDNNIVDDTLDNNIDNNINNNIIQQIQEEILNEGIITPPITRKVLMPKAPVKKRKYKTIRNKDGSITLHRERVRRVLSFESPKKIYPNKKDNYPSLKLFHKSAEQMKINNIREMTPAERALHFSMEPQPVRRSSKWAPHKF
tara:strand:- start:3541 stop:4059 length:519 start_codon:yes stop_codon:yes gene_type:complete